MANKLIWEGKDRAGWLRKVWLVDGKIEVEVPGCYTDFAGNIVWGRSTSEKARADAMEAALLASLEQPLPDIETERAQEPVFKEGDIVEYELAFEENDKPERPRWDHHRDFGASGVWQSDSIEFIGDTWCRTRLHQWYWPLDKHDDYSTDQWNRPGFLRKVKV